jgi:hypothetical protein
VGKKSTATTPNQNKSEERRIPMFIKSIARGSLVACMVLAGAFTPGDNPPHMTAELETDVGELSVQQGGWQPFHLRAGAEEGNRWYLILGSLSGNSPGIQVQDVTIPLNYDIYTQFCVSRPNAGFIRNQLGRLDPMGNAEADLFLPAGLAKGFVGSAIEHAYVVFDEQGRITKVSNPVQLVLTD